MAAWEALLKPVEDLLLRVADLSPLTTRAGDDPRENTLLLLKAKVLPELRAKLDLPLFVGVHGGTNVGKSTVFNALAGKLLSPSLVVASTTKHPLILAHHRWRASFLDEGVFPDCECRELVDPKELIVDAERTNLFFFRFHDDASAEDVAIIDSPDFDSDLTSNAKDATRIAAIADVALFVTTAQKYKDRVLVEHLRRFLHLKKEVVLILNMVEEPIVFETILDDLRTSLGTAADDLPAVRLQPTRAKHPEEELRADLQEQVLERISRLRAGTTKQSILRETILSVVEQSKALVASYSIEAGFKREIENLLRSTVEKCSRDYKTSFQLALPEETLAIRKAIGLTELGPYLQLRPEVEKASKALKLVGAAIRRFNETLRRVMIRISRSDEGTIDPGETSLEEYARSRNVADTDSVLRVAEALRLRVEAFVRGHEETSALARQLVRMFFTPEQAKDFAQASREAHQEALGKTAGTGEEILPEMNRFLSQRRRKARFLTFLAIAFKLAAGLIVAWKLPPHDGILALLNPLEWLSFAVGYFLAAYVIALCICLKIRKQVRFRKAREEACAITLRSVYLQPLQHAMDQFLTDKELYRIADISREIEEKMGKLKVETPKNENEGSHLRAQ